MKVNFPEGNFGGRLADFWLSVGPDRRIVSEYAVIRAEWIVGKHKAIFRG